MYEVLLHRNALKVLERLPESYRSRLTAALNAMEEDPLTCGSDIRKLRGELAGKWRLRVGEVRVVFAVDTDAHKVFVEGISFRGSAYRE